MIGASLIYGAQSGRGVGNLYDHVAIWIERMTENYLCLGLALALIFLVAALAIRAAIVRVARTPRSELQRALKRNGISVAILGKADDALLWTDAAGYVDDKNAAAEVSHAEHRIIERINRLFD